MKTFTLLTLLFSHFSFATVDAYTDVYILVKDFHTEEYFVKQVPIIGCGTGKTPNLSQLTKPYSVNGGLGCGGNFQEQLNALTCAKKVEVKEDENFITFSKITLDISACEDKDSEDFLVNVKKVVKLNFATKSVTPQLKLIK